MDKKNTTKIIIAAAASSLVTLAITLSVVYVYMINRFVIAYLLLYLRHSLWRMLFVGYSLRCRRRGRGVRR